MGTRYQGITRAVYGSEACCKTAGLTAFSNTDLNRTRYLVKFSEKIPGRFAENQQVGLTHLVSNKEDTTLVHPDADISKRILIIPFSGIKSDVPNIAQELFAALVIKFKENFKNENLFIIDFETISETLKKTSGDAYDALFKECDKNKAKELAVKFRANTVVFGHVNNFTNTVIPDIFFGGQTTKSAINVDYSIYKLDADEIIIKDAVRRKGGAQSNNDLVMRTASVIVGKILDKYKTLSATNKFKDTPIVLDIVGDKIGVKPK